VFLTNYYRITTYLDCFPYHRSISLGVSLFTFFSFLSPSILQREHTSSSLSLPSPRPEAKSKNRILSRGRISVILRERIDPHPALESLHLPSLREVSLVGFLRSVLFESLEILSEHVGAFSFVKFPVGCLALWMERAERDGRRGTRGRERVRGQEDASKRRRARDSRGKVERGDERGRVEGSTDLLGAVPNHLASVA